MSVKRVRINGRLVWQARVAYRGLRQATIRPTRDAALDAEAALRRDLKIKAGEITSEGARPATLRALFDYYVGDLQERGKGANAVSNVRSTARAVETLAPALLDAPVTKLQARDVFAFRQARARTRKPGTINRDLKTLRAMLKIARPDFKFPGGSFLPEDNTRVRWLRPEEEVLLFATMRSPFQEIARLAALTLMRQGEILTLRREHVHLEQGVVLLPKAKGGARPVILNGEAQKLLRAHLATHTNPWVFPNLHGRPYHRNHVGNAFRAAARGVGLTDFTFHDLRHHGATMALNRGFSAPIVMALGGWKSEAMMRRYAAVTDQTLRAAAEAVAGNEPMPQARTAGELGRVPR